MTKKTPSKATRAISPKDFKHPHTYIAAKMGALIGASRQWVKAPTEGHIVSQERIKREELEQRLKNKDEMAIFPYIAYPNDPQNLTHPFVIESIRKWQEDPKSKWKLEMLASRLIPDRRGKRKHTPDEEVFRFYWKEEWMWYHILSYKLEEIPLSSTKAQYERAIAMYEESAKRHRRDPIGHTLSLCKERPGRSVARKVKFISRETARMETALKFQINPSTIREKLSRYE